MAFNSPDIRGDHPFEQTEDQLEAFQEIVDGVLSGQRQESMALEDERRRLREEREALRQERESFERERQQLREEYEEAMRELRRELKRVREQDVPNDEEDMIPQTSNVVFEDDVSNDSTQILPPPDPIILEREDSDAEINIGEVPEPRIEDDIEYMRERFIFGANMYEIDEENAQYVERAMLLEVSNHDYDSHGIPPFIMVRLRNEYNPNHFEYYGVRFTRNNLHFLISLVSEPWRAWENYRETDAHVPSDLVEKIALIAEEPAWFKVTHLAFYNPDAHIETRQFNAIGQRMDQEILKRFYDMFPSESFVRVDVDTSGNLIRRRTRYGRFMGFKMDFEALEKSECSAALFWKNYPEKANLEKDFQIPWFSANPDLKEEDDLPINSEIYSIPCFLYALKAQISPELYDRIRNLQSIHGCGVKTSIFRELQEKYGVKLAFKVYRVYKQENLYKINYDRYPARSRRKLKESDNWDEISLMFWENHYMQYKEVDYNGQRCCFLRVLEDSKRNGLLVPYNGYEYANLYDNFAFDEMLNFDDKTFIKNTKNGYSFINDYDKAEYKEKHFCKDVWFADFEASTNEKYHKPFLIVTKGVQITQDAAGLKYTPIYINDKTVFYFWGNGCERDFLDFLLNRYGKSSSFKRKPDARVYFYNLRYDFTFLLSELRKVNKTVKGNKLYSVTGHYQGRFKNVFIDFWDALPLFQTSLKKASASYLTPVQKETIQKEIFPYSLYTYDFFNLYPNGWCPLGLFLSHLSKEDIDKLVDVHSREHQNFMKFVQKTPEKMVNYKEYAIFYCEQDVNCLEKIMINFASLLSGRGLEGIHGLPPFDLNLWKYRTASSIGYDYFNRTVIFKENEEGEMIPRFDWAVPKCALRALIQKTIRGGRVMTRDNRPYHYIASGPNNFLMDYDGVSLYPSAMSLLWVTDGIPEFIKNEREHYTVDHFKAWFAAPEERDSYKPFKDGCIHLVFLQVNRHLHFPMLCIKDAKTKLNNYTNTFNIVDTWVNTIDLYNLLDFQNAVFEFDAAIVWRGERHFEIQDSIKDLFDFRKDNKKHPIQLVTKLMMNSIFGKSILKPTGKEKKVIDKVRYRKNIEGVWEPTDNWREFFNANMYRIHKFEDLGDKVEVEIYKRDVSSSLNIFGSNVLAMARRIIGRVMALAEEIEETHWNMSPGIFYTDTDSFHIRKDLLELLETEYYERYGKSLAGSELTQFHVDFDIPKNFEEGETVVGAVESYFIMKKIYVDKLLGSKGTIGYHMRMKGIPTDLVKFSDYEKIFRGESVTFDLLNGHTSFFYKDGHVGSRLVMTREIMTRDTRERRKLEKQNKRTKI